MGPGLLMLNLSHAGICVRRNPGHLSPRRRTRSNLELDSWRYFVFTVDLVAYAAEAPQI